MMSRTDLFWEHTTGEGDSSAWAAGVVYSVDDVVEYAGGSYTCIQAHTSQVGWEPDVTPSLWEVTAT